jgi:hypothetical protein
MLLSRHTRRCDFITLLGGAATWPLAARAQQGERVRRVGVLIGWPVSDAEARSERAAFIQELQKLGWTDGHNLRTDTRWANPADPNSMHRFAKELVALQPVFAPPPLQRCCKRRTEDGKTFQRVDQSTFNARGCASTR